MCHDQEPGDFGHNRYQRQVLFELEWANSVVTGNFVFIILVTLGMPLIFRLVSKPHDWLFAVCWLFTLVWLVSSFIWTITIRKRLESITTQRIISAGIIERLAGGTDWIEEIYRFTSWPWTLIGLGARPRELRGWIRLFASNLDWFLEEPRRLFRIEWPVITFLRIVPFIVIALLLVTGFFSKADPGMIIAGFMIFFFALLIAGILMFPSLYRRRMACGILHRMLSERFDA